MNRSKFIKSSLIATGAAVSGSSLSTFDPAAQPDDGPPFKMDYAPHQGMFSGSSFVDQIQKMYDLGFRSIEDNGFLGRSLEEQNAIGKQLERLNMRMGVFVVDGGDNWKPSLATGKQEFEDRFLATCHRSVEAAKRCRAQWLTVVPGFFDRSQPLGVQMANIIGTLRKAAEIFEPHGLIMVIETLSDTPDLLLQKTDQTYLICKAINSPSCKILYDIYHMQRTEGDLIKTIDRCWDEIAYFQIGDNPGRKEPGTGEINYPTVLKHVYEKGYRGVWGMEHGISQKGALGEKTLVEAYRKLDRLMEV